ncbi:ABC transporter ATP-binding protein [Candidatus Symbiopectobacterium sp. NZEC127]|uniref:ABC transporter ATP-binding protein n=1 Tax=Candidatus Symbiopectobacterium sp. NZEC127 TaxID=2820472 RepID=UPI002227A9E5|nr:ABC transporter ATP-binding protein [Candidatus Symbiopectobacterium sp. NZEC127]MCW2486070.1 ABC transporter ATP-binding protein [Candidatus Symbiopectobacterium sp. NZEC127]
MNKLVEFYKLFNYSIFLLFSSSPLLSVLFVFLVVIQGIMPTLSVMLGIRLGNLIGHANQTDIFITSIAWVVTFVIPGVLAPIVSTLQSVLNQKATFLTQKKIMLSVSRINDLNVIETEKIHNDFETLSREASNKPLNLLVNLVSVFRDSITLVSLSLLISTIVWWLPFALLFPAYPVALAVSKSQKDIFNAFADKSGASRLIKYFISVLLNTTLAKEIRVFNLSNFFMSKHRESFHQLECDLNEIRKKQILRPQGWNLLYLVSASSVMYWFSNHISQGEISTGELLGVIQSITFFGLTCQWGVYTLAYLSVCFEYFRKLYDIENLCQDERAMYFTLPDDKTIIFENVSFSYREQRCAVSDVSFQIKEGEHIALIGENGAGKSTLVKLLCRLYTPTSGRITLGGIDINEIDITVWREYISAIFQDFGHYVLSVEENIYLGDVANGGNREALERVCLQAGFTLPAGVDYTDLLGKEFSGTDLSGGQWQRLAIARALYSSNSGIVILDEPTSALDPRIEADFFKRFYQSTKGKTSITVTHRMGAVKNAEKVIVMKNGVLVEQGTPDALSRLKGEYYELVNIQKELWNAS